MHPYLDPPYLLTFIDLALKEDIGTGDVTSLATIPEGTLGQASLLVKDQGLIAGVAMAKEIFHRLDPSLSMEIFIQDGHWVQAGDVVFKVSGAAMSILMGERLVLNCMQRMSGIATYTRKLVQILDGTRAKLLDTRKTTPNFRLAEKWACHIGGAVNHRFGLFDMILIKDNHVDYAGGITAALQDALNYREKHHPSLSIEIEVRNMEELEEVLRLGGVQRILLDNFQPSDLRTAIRRINGNFITEASGGIREENLRAFAETGVDYISVGALTHQIKSLDLSLKAS